MLGAGDPPSERHVRLNGRPSTAVAELVVISGVGGGTSTVREMVCRDSEIS